MSQKNIYLSGFMGSGKTTVGKLLANCLGISFIDTDSLIEKKTGMTISQIFSKKGESFFREQERLVLLSLSHESPSVISLGGGMILSESNRRVIAEGIWVNLKATPATLIKRLEHFPETLVAPKKKTVSKARRRPLLGIKIKRENLEELLRQRRPYYNLASIQVETDGLSANAVMGNIKFLCNKYASH